MRGKSVSQVSLIRSVISCSVVFLTIVGFNPSNSAFSTNLTPAYLWSTYSIRPLRKISRVIHRQWSWQLDQLSSVEHNNKITLILPGSKVLYKPYAPKLPYVPVTIPFNENESLSYIKVTRLQWSTLPFDAKDLDKHPGLLTLDNTHYPSSVSGENHADSPDGTFSYSVTLENERLLCEVKLYPLHIWKSQIWLINHLTIEVGLCTDQQPTYGKAVIQKSVIICPDELTEEASQLKTLHMKKGFDTSVIRLSHIQKTITNIEPVSLKYITGYRDARKTLIRQIPDYDYTTADKIRSFLLHLSKQGLIDYLTLLGDASYIPPSEYIISVNNTDPYDRMIPTDLFYMAPDVFANEIPLRIIAGRIPVRSKNEAQLYVNKLRSFEADSQENWIKSVALFGGDMFEDDYYGELQTNYMVNNGDFGDFSIKKYFETENQYNRESILKTIEDNSHGFYLMSSHGRGDYLRLPGGSIDTIDIMNLGVKKNNPIWISNSCLNGAWDTRLSNIRYGTEKKLGLATSFAESLLFSNAGGIAYIGGARVNYAGMDYFSDKGEIKVLQLYNMDAMIHYFFKSYGKEKTTLGEIFKKSIQLYIHHDFDNGYETVLKTLFGYCLLGDPTLSLPGKNNPPISPILFKKTPDFTPVPINDGAPFINIKQNNTFVFSCVKDSVKITLCDYLNPQKPIKVESIHKPDSSDTFIYRLPEFKKTRFALRIENEEAFEIRFVGSSRFLQDIRLIKPSVFTLLRQGSPFEFSMNIHNIGLSDVNEVNIEQASPFETKCIKLLPHLTYATEYPVPISIDTSKTGHFTWKFSCWMDNQDLDISDNTIEIEFEITENPVDRIGVICFDWSGLRSDLNQTLWLNNVNEFYRENQRFIEIKGLTSEEYRSLEALSLSTLLIYDTPYVPNMEELKKIIQFEKNGGSVLVMGAFDYRLLSLIGYTESNTFHLHTGDSSFQPFYIMKSKRIHFSQAVFQLPCFESYSVADNVTECISNSAFIVGFSDDQYLYIIQNKKWVTYSGNISKLDFNRSKETFLFFTELVSYTNEQSAR